MFGQQQSSGGGLFGTGAKPTGSLFGTTTQTTSPFGQPQQQQTTSNIFGSPVSTKTPFGQTSTLGGGTGLFGTKTGTSMFGTGTTGTTPSFGFGGATGQTQTGTGQTSSIFGTSTAVVPFVPKGTTVKFDPLKSTDTMMKNGQTQTIQTQIMCITAMKTYESKSLEELRVEDYIEGRKHAQTSSLFGIQQSSQQQASPFSKPFSAGTGSILGTQVSQPQATSSIFGTQPQQTGSLGLFGQQKPATALFTPSAQQQQQPTNIFGPKPATNIFGAAQSTPTGGLFGQQQSTAPATSIFGQTTQQQQSPFSFQSSQPQQTGVGMFGGGQKSIFSSATTQPTPSFGGAFNQPQQQQQSIFGQQQSTGGGGIFGGPAQQKSIFQPQQTPTLTLGGQPQQQTGSMFGQGSGLGQKTLFGQQPATGSIFGGPITSTAPATAFGAAQPAGSFFNQPSTTPFTGAVSPPIVLGSNVDVSAMQRVIIEAQLSALPYGDSDLLKSTPLSPPRDKLKSPEKDGAGGIDSAAQRKLRYLASKGVLPNVVIGSPEPPKTGLMPPIVTPPEGSAVSTTSPGLGGGTLMPPIVTPSPQQGQTTAAMTTTITTTVTTKVPGTGRSVADTEIGTLKDLHINYRPLVLLPSVGFGASLGLDTSDAQQPYYGSPTRLKTRTFLSRPGADGSQQDISHQDSSISSIMSTGRKAGGHIKSLDLSVVDAEEERAIETVPSRSIVNGDSPMSTMERLHQQSAEQAATRRRYIEQNGGVPTLDISGICREDAVDAQRLQQQRQQHQQISPVVSTHRRSTIGTQPTPPSRAPSSQYSTAPEDEADSFRSPATSPVSARTAATTPQPISQQQHQQALVEGRRSSAEKRQPQQAPKGIRLMRPEYYSEPSIDILNTECNVDGVCRIEGGLTVGRLGYGSVFWPGPFELSADTDLDALVHIRNKEVVVYPDEEKKPDVGKELNRQAEISLERIWPVDKQRRSIKDADELRRMNFRDKLERLCTRMDATFRDYQPATGTWQFAVEHFSKYGLIDDDDDDIVPIVMDTNREQNEMYVDADLKERARLQSLVQKANIPLREVHRQLNGSNSLNSSGGVEIISDDAEKTGQLKRTLKAELDSSLLGYESDSKFVPDDKRIRFDDTLFESSKLLTKISIGQKANSQSQLEITKDRKSLTTPVVLRTREPINQFVGLTKQTLKNLGVHSSVSIRDTCWSRHVSFEPSLTRTSCRVSFSEDLIYTRLPPASYVTAVEVSKLKAMVPTVESIFVDGLRRMGALDQLDPLFSERLLRLRPPSTLLRLIDAFVLETYKKQEGKQVDTSAIESLRSILLLRPKNKEEVIDQRIQMGRWLESHLQSNNDWAAEVHGYKNMVKQQRQQQQQRTHHLSGSHHQSTSPNVRERQRNDEIFEAIFRCLVNGSVDTAIWLAVNSRMFQFALFLSGWKALPAALLLRQEASKQLIYSEPLRSANETTRAPLTSTSSFMLNISQQSQQQKNLGYYEKILGLLSTAWGTQPDEANANAVQAVSMAMEAFRGQKLNWFQILGIMIWYWTGTDCSLLDCINQMETLEKRGVIELFPRHFGEEQTN